MSGTVRPERAGPERRGRRRDRESGAALMLVIWLAAVAASLAVGFVEAARGDAVLARNGVEAIRARAATEAGLVRTAAMLLREEILLVPGGQRLGFDFDDIAVAVRVEGESGRFDLNKIPPELLADLAARLGLAEEAAKRVVDAVKTRRVRGTERPAGVVIDRRPLDSSATQTPKRTAEFAHTAELFALPGLDRAAAAKLATELGVYARRDQVEVDLASPLVRDVLANAKTDPRQDGTGGGSGLPLGEQGGSGEGQGLPLGSADGAAGAGGGGAAPPAEGPLAGSGFATADRSRQPQAPLAERRSDPAQLYRVTVEVRLPSGFATARRFVVWLGNEDRRGFRVMDSSAPLLEEEISWSR